MARKANIPKFYAEDIQKIRKYLSQTPWDILEARNKAIIALLLKTGVKTGILASLNRDDFDRKENVIIPPHPKAPQQIRLDSKTKEILYRYLDYRKDNFRPLLKSRSNRRGGRLSSRQVQRIVKEFAQRKDMRRNFTPKAFRHTVGLYYAALGADSTTIDSILGNVAPWVKAHYRKKIKTRKVKRRESKPRNAFKCLKHKVELTMIKPP